MSARGITNMFYFSMQACLIGKMLIAIPFSYIGNQVGCDCGIEFSKQTVIVGFNFNISNSSLILLLLI